MNAMGGPTFLPATALAWREVVRFLRQRSRIVGALATPLLFWVLIGSGLGRSFRPPGTVDEQHFLTYFYPGITMLVVLFTAIFSCISLIEDRHQGFLQSVLVAPVAPGVIVAGKVAGSTLLAVAQAALLLALAPLLGLRLGATGLAAALAALTLASIGLSALGFVFAWWLDSVQGFHAVMNVLLMPMWLLSGALFPAAGASPWMRTLMTLNPLTYAVAALRRALDPQAHDAVGQLPAPGTCWAVLGASAAVACFLAARCATNPTGRART